MTDTTNLPYKPFLDKDGKPKVSQYGHIVSARLTKEEEAQIDQLIAEGKTQREIVKIIGTTQQRVATYLKAPKTAERVNQLLLTQQLPRDIQKLTGMIEELVEVLYKQDRRINEIYGQLQKVDANARRQRIGRANAERTMRTRKAEINRLRQKLYRLTGRKG